MSTSVLYHLVENAMEAEQDLKPFSMVYVAQAYSASPCEFWIKVGRSFDPDKRIETLQKEMDGKKKNVTLFPEGVYEIELLCIAAGGKETERLLRQLLEVEYVCSENRQYKCGEYLLLSKPQNEHIDCNENECLSSHLIVDDLVDFLLDLGFETSLVCKILGIIWHRENNYVMPLILRETEKQLERLSL